MNPNQNQLAYAQTVGTTPTNFPIIQSRDPTVNDVNYRIGQFWINTIGIKLWYLNSQNTLVTAANPNGFLQSTWELISVSSVLVTLSDTSNTPVFPSSTSATPPDNIQIVGGTGISVVSNPGSHLLTITNTGSASTETLSGNDGVSVSPTAGTIQTLGVVVANSTFPQALYTNSGGGNIENFNIQLAAAIASTNVAKVGISAYNQAQFAVDGNGYVTLVGGITPPTLTLTPNSGTSPVGPTAGGTINVLGAGSITTVGSANTVTAELAGLTQFDVLVGQGTTTIGLVTPTATSGIPLISQGSAAYPVFGTAVVAGGGTGDTSFTPYAVITGGTTSTGPLQNVVGVGTAGQILTSNGASALPSWQNAAASAVTSVTGTNGVTASPTTGNVVVSGVDATTTTVGVASFNAANFTVTTGAVSSLPITVTGSGGITITGSPVNLGGTLTIANTNGSPVVGFTPDTTVGGGVSPVVPNASGLVKVTSGPTFATGTQANALRTDTTGANTLNIELQYAGTSSGLTPIADNYGIAQFNSINFTVSSGLVSSNNFTINTTGSLTGGGSITLGGTLTLSSTPTSLTYTNVNHAASPYTVLSTDQYISCDTSGGTVELLFPNTTTSFRTWIVKDRLGDASTNAISITTPGGSVTFDGVTLYKIISNYGAIQLLFNATNYEVY